METLLTAAVDALKHDLRLAALCATWLTMTLAGTAAAALAYWSRLRERSAMVNPPQHRLFRSSHLRSQTRDFH